VRFFNPDLPERLTKPCWTTVHSWGPQLIPKTLIQDAIFKAPQAPLDFHGAGGQESPTEEQFDRYSYPIAKEKGGVPIHMIWTDTPCRITCWNHGNWTIEAFKEPSIECIIAQHPWMENECSTPTSSCRRTPRSRWKTSCDGAAGPTSRASPSRKVHRR
jgi:trimethylamine-N-oxide reductase (cytochrome c)